MVAPADKILAGCAKIDMSFVAVQALWMRAGIIYLNENGAMRPMAALLDKGQSRRKCATGSYCCQGLLRLAIISARTRSISFVAKRTFS
jgi:hypothetical protein